MTTEHTTNWPSLVIGLHEQLMSKNAVISYNFVDIYVNVSCGTGPEAKHAEWGLNGSLKISVGAAGQLTN